MQKNIKINRTVINYFNYGDSAELEYHLDDFEDILPDNLKGALATDAEEELVDEAIDFVADYLDTNIEWAADELDYFDLDAGYAYYNMVFKHNGKYYGVAYTEDCDGNADLGYTYKYIEDFPEFEPYTRTHYRPKAK